MCIRKILNWFNGPEEDPEPIEETNRTALLFGINNYPGSANDLNGCLNDIDDVEEKLNEEFPGFKIKKFKDSEVTAERFISECEKAISELGPGGTVVFYSDSCFSKSNTRDFELGLIKSNHPPKSRFKDPGLPPRKIINRKVFRSDPGNMKWIAFSGCGEHETSADAYINRRYNGAFTYYALKSTKPGDTYQTQLDITRTYLPGSGYSQTPSIEGPVSLTSRKLYEGPTLIIWYSGHGSYTYDLNGDEADGYDEVICCYNRNVTDDEIGAILQKIPV